MLSSIAFPAQLHWSSSLSFSISLYSHSSLLSFHSCLLFSVSNDLSLCIYFACIYYTTRYKGGQNRKLEHPALNCKHTAWALLLWATRTRHSSIFILVDFFLFLLQPHFCLPPFCSLSLPCDWTQCVDWLCYWLCGWQARLVWYLAGRKTDQRLFT